MDKVDAVTTLFEAFQLLQYLKTFRTKYKNAPNLLEDLQNECVTTQTVLIRVHEIVRSRGKDAALMESQQAVMDVFNTNAADLDNVLKTCLRQLGWNPNTKNPSFAHSRSKVVRNDTYLLGMLSKIRDKRKCIEFIMTAMTLDSSKTMDKVHREPSPQHQPSRPGQSRSLNGATALHSAVISQSVESVKYLLRKDLDPNARASNGWTPLMCLVEHGPSKMSETSVDIVRLLLTHGADPTIGEFVDGKTPLHTAAGRDSLCHELEAMIYTTFKVMRKSVDLLRGDNFETPLFNAAISNNTKGLKLLIGCRADVNHRACSDYSCPLAAAVSGDALGAAEVLLTADAAPDGVAEGLSPLYAAVTLPINPDITRLLLRYGASIDSPNSNGRRPIHLASSYGRGEAVRILLNAGADPNSLSADGHSPFMLASMYGHVHILQILLNEGRADWQYQNRRGVSAFLLACRGGHILCASFLVGMGVDVDEKTSEGKTALHYAARHGHLEMVKFLMQVGCNADAGLDLCVWDDKNMDSDATAAQVASVFGQDDIARFITSFATNNKTLVWRSVSSENNV